MRKLAFAMLLSCLAATASAAAGEKSHTVRSGESASAIAMRYYGKAELGDFLLRYNGKAGSVIRAGENLRIPYCEVHRVEKGDSWSGLAMKYLGRAQIHPALAALNGYETEAMLRIGDAIVIPVEIPHVLERGDTLASLSERFYGDGGFGEVLKAYNEIADPRRLSVGETVKVPLVSIRLQESPEAEKPRQEPAPVQAARAAPGNSDATGEVASKKSVAEPSAPDLPSPDPPSLEPPAYRPPVIRATPLDGEIGEASKAFAEGDFLRARRLLESLRAKELSTGSDDQKAEALRLLAFVYVAFDMGPEACVAFRSMSGLTAETRLDPDLVSPKIRDALSRCGG